MKKLRWLGLLGLCCLLDVGHTNDANAQCDPGMPISEILQNNVSAGWVARTEVATGYVEHWCLLPNFRNFGSERGNVLTATTFRQTVEPFSSRVFTDQCKRGGGTYHVANVSIQRL